MEIIAFDPGYATGIAVGEFSETEPLRLVDALIVAWPEFRRVFPHAFGDLDPETLIVSEQFRLISGNDFTADLIPVKVEGLMESVFEERIIWRPASDKTQVSDETLQRIGWWKTGNDVEWEDGRDANDAIIHMLGYVAFELNHTPTLRAYFKDSE